MGRSSRLKKVIAAAPLRLDFGSGPNPREGFQGVDQHAFDGKVTHVMNIAWRPPDVPGLIDPATGQDAKMLPSGFVQWKWEDNSVSEAHSSHFVEHLTAAERVHFCNELYRVLVPNGTCQIIVPHWASCRAYGDPTHQWPPVSEFWFYYLSKVWRDGNAPHTDIKWNPDGFACNFNATWGYSLRPDLSVRNQEFQQFAIANYKETCQDLIATLTKMEMP